VAVISLSLMTIFFVVSLIYTLRFLVGAGFF
jgi:hypothetical protein